MPAYEPGEHLASDNLYVQASSARQAAKVAVKTVKTAAAAAATPVGKVAGGVAHGVKAAVRRVRFGRRLGPKITVKGRLQRRLYLAKRGLKAAPRKAGKGVVKAVGGSPAAYAKGVGRVTDRSMQAMQSAAGDEASQTASQATAQLAKTPARGVKTIRHTVGNARKARKAVKRARLAVKQVKYARTGLQAVKAVGQVVGSSLSALGMMVLPLLAGILVIVAIAGMFTSLFSSPAAACTPQQVRAAGFGAVGGKLEGLAVSPQFGASVVDYRKMGISPTWFENDASGYQYEQCTWWVANRWKSLGLEVDHHMGNGAQWAASAKRLGYPTGSTPRLGAIVSMQGGVLGASLGPYGHVAVVEQIDKDGSIWVSESGTILFGRYHAPILSKYTKSQLDMAFGRYTYIYSTRGKPAAMSASGSSASTVSYGCQADDQAGGAGASSKDAKAAQTYAHEQCVKRYGWGETDWQALVKLWNKESGWNYRATNPSSGAYGIPQALPGDKMASKGADWKTNPHTQIDWGLDYIRGRYGSPSAAWKHSQQTNWY